MNKLTYTFQIDKFNKSFAGKQVVYDFSLQAQKGEIIGFIGPNGSGKTTVLRMICGLIKPDSGTGECLGYNMLTEGDKIRGRLGYMAQSFSLYNYLTIGENLQFIAQLYLIENPEKRIAYIAERFHLTENINQLARQLSMGWKQRLALAASMLHEPEILFLDEPSAGLDPKIKLDFWQIIQEVANEGVTVLVSTHDVSELDRCNTVIDFSLENTPFKRKKED